MADYTHWEDKAKELAGELEVTRDENIGELVKIGPAGTIRRLVAEKTNLFEIERELREWANMNRREGRDAENIGIYLREETAQRLVDLHPEIDVQSGAYKDVLRAFGILGEVMPGTSRKLMRRILD